MIVDCDTCAVRGDACQECVISVLLGAPPSVELGSPEQLAIDALAEAGMVPKLRLVPARNASVTGQTPGRSQPNAERSSLRAERLHPRVS
jgi:hypothetical protein